MTNIHSSQLYDNATFYDAFTKDILKSQHSLIIESPFITLKRLEKILPYLERLRRKGVAITINTRNPEEHDGMYVGQAHEAVTQLQNISIRVLYTVRHHRKLAIIDTHIVWEGSLNILSHSDSCEMMRRIDSNAVAEDTIRYLNQQQRIY